jgi:hypothetical protein
MKSQRSKREIQCGREKKSPVQLSEGVRSDASQLSCHTALAFTLQPLLQIPRRMNRRLRSGDNRQQQKQQDE